MSCEIKKDTLLTALQRAQSAVAYSDLLPILTFINLRDGFVSAYDGRHAIRVKVPELVGIQTSVKFDKFIKAVEACEDVVQLNLMKTKLEIKGGRFRAKVSIVDVDFPYQMTEQTDDDWLKLDDKNFISTMRTILPFISQDMSRPWQTGVWLNGTHAYATQNVSLVRMACVWPLAPTLLPRAVVEEMLVLDSAIQSVCVYKNRVLFDCGDYLMDVQVMSDNYSNTVVQMLDEVDKNGVDEIIPEGLGSAVTKIKSFVSDSKFPSVFFGPDGVSTEDKEHFASFGGFDLPKSSFNVDAILNVIKVSTHLSLKDFPKCAFRGEGIVGMIAGLRV